MTAILLPPITETTFIIGILVAVAGAAWVAWVIGYQQGIVAGAKLMDERLRRNLNLPPRR